MKSDKPKVLHELCGEPLLGHVLENVESLGVVSIVVVAGYGSDAVKAYVCPRAGIVEQKERRGSGHALLQARKRFMNAKGPILVLNGDTPLLDRKTLSDLIESFQSQDAECALVSAVFENPEGYGRILRNGSGWVNGIVEELNATDAERQIQEINVGAYCFKKKPLLDALSSLKPDSKKGEYYLTDVVKFLAQNGRVTSVRAETSSQALGINSRKDLSIAEECMQARILDHWMSEGVTIKAPSSVYIDKDVKIGRDTVIYPHTVIEGPSEIGRNCRIGPFAHIRKGVRLDDEVTIGNFVEVTRSRVGPKTLIKHLSYIGDAEIGSGVNIGAGTVTANYDGRLKHKTIIEKDAAIGSGTVLVAPVRMKRASRTGAGAIVTKGQVIPAGRIAVGVPARVLKKGKAR